jgi:hypothetical protein
MSNPADELTISNVRPWSVPRTLDFKDDESLKLFLGKIEELTNHVLYVSIGVFAVLPVALTNLRRPYAYSFLVTILICFGVFATLVGAVLKVASNGYYRRVSRLLTSVYQTDISPIFWITFQLAEVAAFVQVAAFVVFIAVNAPKALQKTPQVESIKIEKSIVEPGDVVPVSVSAEDADDDRLTYRWEANGGTVVNSDTSTTTWLAPASISSAEQPFNIRAYVSDGTSEGYRDAAVLVRQSPTIQGNVERLCLMAKPLAASTGTDENVACDQIRKYIQEADTSAEKTSRVELVESQMKKQTELPAKLSGKKKRWFGCCTTALLPLFCDPGC